MTIQGTHPRAQAVRRVYETGQPTTPSNVTHIACHPDSSSSGKDVILWDDIKAVFGDVAHVRAGSTVQTFLKGGDFKKYVFQIKLPNLFFSCIKLTMLSYDCHFF